MNSKTYQGTPNGKRMSITTIPRLIKGFTKIAVVRECIKSKG